MTTRRTVRAIYLTFLTLLLGLLAGTAPATAADDQVKYYEVTAADQSPDGLARIAERLLGEPARAEEIYRLNAGRRQRDGLALLDTRRLRAQWLLVLPWDAAGDGVRMGPLPAGSAGSCPPTGGGPGCVSPLPAPRPRSDWAGERITTAEAWARTQGEGVMVAVVDSGVDAASPQLRGRVALGADVTSGTAPGNLDRLGSGTGMAGIIAGAGGTPGIAPAATILPLRVAGDVPQADPAQVAIAIEIAVTAGARVIALGAFADPSNTLVAAAARAATAHDVVVVVPAANAGAGATTLTDGLLRVGGAGPEGQRVAEYQPEAVDVTAPGIDVMVLTPAGAEPRSRSGSEYAVAFVAGTAALVRAAYPDLDAAAVTHRIKVTADGASAGVPDRDRGWGTIDPDAAVGAVVPGEQPTRPAAKTGGTGRLALSATAGVVTAALAGSVFLIRRRLRNRT
ncbi:S8 family serine peptidase [Micromonospora gifhornensis]|uniref:S8 family serine peptidase n=1 Tax=Micromonospora gifhornensis TaxID=84594 RepID=UPI0019531AE8|nr:S8 family serine peptidase [Micromonospora gifhornensis]